MGLLAYDPDRVGRLHRSLQLAADGLRAVSCGDPAAADALQVVRAMNAQIEQVWLPLASHLLTQDPLSRSQRDRQHLGALDQSLVRVMADGYGWSVQADPLQDDTAVVTAEEARALGAMLGEVDLAALLDDPVQLRRLAQQLQVIGRDPRLGAEFVANMRDWSTLTTLLGTRRAELAGGTRAPAAGATTVADLGAVVDGLMAAWRTTLPASVLQARTSATVASLLPPLGHPDPYVQALLLRSLRLDAITVAQVAGELLRGWVDTKQTWGRGTIDLEQPYGANAADLLLPLLLGDPAACTYFMTLVADHPAILFETLDDPEIGHRVAMIGTDPANSESAAAGRAVLAVLGWFDVDPYGTAPNTDGYAGDYGPFLADLVAPWLLQFSGANEEWAADDMTKQHGLAIALRDDTGLQHLAAGGRRIADGFTSTLAGGPITATTLELAAQVGGLLNILGQLQVEQQVSDERDRPRYLWDLTWTVIGAAGSLLAGGPASVAVGGTVAGVQQLLGPAFGEPDPERVRRDAEYARDVASTVAVAVTLAALFQSWRAGGDLPAGATPPPVPSVDQPCPSDAYRDEVEAWTAQLPGGPTGVMALGALTIVDNFSSRGQAEQQCARASA